MTTYSNTGDLNGGGPFYVRLTIWDTTQDVVNNRTLFEWRIYIGCSSNGWGTFGASGDWTVNIGGNYYDPNPGAWEYSGLDFRPAGSSAGREIYVGGGNTWIGHNADGTRPGFPSDAWVGTDHTSIGAGVATTWSDAPTIPRATQPSVVQGNQLTVGQTVTINLPRASAGFTHDVNFDMVGAYPYATVGTGLGTSVSYTIPLAAMNIFPNSPTVAARFFVATYSGGTLIGTAVYDFTLTAAASAVPSFTTITNTEMTAGVAANVGRYVQGISTLGLAITGAAAGGYGATIKSYKIEVAGQTINAASGTTPTPLATAGTYNITGTVTDSRDRSVSKTVSITVLAYAPPTLTAVSVQRALSTGVVDEDEGTYFRVNINASVASLINSTQRNAIVYRISTRVRGTTTWTLKSNVTPGGITFNSFALIQPYAITTAYEVLVEVVDDFATTVLMITVPVAEIFMHWNGKLGVGIGKYHERGRLDIAGDYFFQRTGLDDWRALSSIGTTAERDAVYAAPANDTQRVALANKKVTWFNTDRGWEESYYATTGLTGLTAKGLVTGVASGWYPLAEGPFINLQPTTTHASTPSTHVANWNGVVRRNGGAAWFTHTTNSIIMQIPGRYDFGWWTLQQNGAGQADFHTQLLDPANSSIIDWMSNVGPVTLTSIYQRADGHYQDQPITKPEQLAVRAVSGNVILHNVTGGTTYPSTRGEMYARYLGPLLVAD